MPAGVPGQGDDVAGADRIAGAARHALVVAVQREVAAAVFENHDQAVALQPADIGNAAAGDRAHFRIGQSGQDAQAERLRGTGANFWDEFGTTTGRPRRVIGSAFPRPDIPAKVCGGAAFIQDLRLPDMWHARVLRAPVEGRLTNFRLQVGESIATGKNIGRIDDPVRFKLAMLAYKNQLYDKALQVVAKDYQW